jgi:hypothetical protein
MQHVGKIKVKAWRGPTAIGDPATDVGGVGWILAENWYPYQRPTFVTPPFAGYISGHSTYSRAAAELLALLTGDEYFPGGLGEFTCPQNEFLVFEDGPSVQVKLQWAKYRDASDQCSLSRIFGGIHPPQDDIPGRKLGRIIGPEALAFAETFMNGTATSAEEASSRVPIQIAGVYPNPVRAGSALALQMAQQGEGMNVRLYNLLGQVVRSVTVPRVAPGQAIVFSTEGLAAGVYLVRAVGPHISVAQKVLVTR